MDHDHAGIACSIDDGADICAAIDTVVTAIRDKHSEDFVRLRDRVRHFELLTTAECEEGTMGEWRVTGMPRMVTTPWGGEEPEDQDQRRGVVLVNPATVDLIATVAHELGHVMATDDDMYERHAPSDEWASEATADYHAFRWGFEAAIRTHGIVRDRIHHPCLPGDPPEAAGGYHTPGLAWWRVDDDFVFHYCAVCQSENDDCEHPLEEYLSNKPVDPTPEELANIEAIKQRKYKITTLAPDDD